MDSYQHLTPAMFVDPFGLEAILVNKVVNNFVGIEHMSGFFQDENDDWFFFFWGPDVKYQYVDDISIFDSMDTMNEWLYANDLYEKENRPYIDSVYIKGDFTASHNAAQELLQSYNGSLKTWDGKGLSNQEYNFFTNNCGQVTMELFRKGTLPSGTNVGDYMSKNRYGSSVLPNVSMINMQNLFYNSATNLTGFEAAMQTQRNKYEKKCFCKMVAFRP